ncbi:MAG TPA: M42 family peptidase [Anaerolineae bacterium]|nr:M42 family peptidase [Anaerolineae bacterium]
MDLFKILKQLSETPSPSGFEGTISQTIQDLWAPYTDEIITDRLGSVIAVKKGNGPEPRPRILLAAHMDEIGLMVNQIVEKHGNGFLRITNLGGIDVRQLYAQRVLVHATGPQAPDSPLPGIISAVPSSWLPDSRQSNAYEMNDFFVDTGLSYENLQQQVTIGDYVTFDQELQSLMGSVAAGKSIDNRASVTAVTATLHELQNRLHHWDVVAVATVQEETRLLGAYTTAFSQKPDAALAIDVTFANAPGTSGGPLPLFDLGTCVPLGLGVNVHPGILNALQEAAKELELKTELDLHGRASGTDAYGIQVARAGVPTGLVGLPIRYMHTVVETIDTRDIGRAGRLMAQFITNLDETFLDKLADSMLADTA